DGVHSTKPTLSDEVLGKLERDFEQAMRAALLIFRDAAFRRYPTGAKRRGPINRALFESWAVVLAEYNLAILGRRTAGVRVRGDHRRGCHRVAVLGSSP